MLWMLTCCMRLKAKKEIHVAHYWQKQGIPFAYFAEVDGVDPSGTAFVNGTLEEIEHELVGDRLVEVDAAILFDIKVTRKRRLMSFQAFCPRRQRTLTFQEKPIRWKRW